MNASVDPCPLSADILARLQAIVGSRHVLTDEVDMAPYLVEWRGLFRGRAAAVVKPGSTEEVSAVLTLSNAEGLRIVPQGGNTGLVGGQTPWETGDEIVLSLVRMNRIREVDAESDTMTVDAGVTLLAAQEAAEAAERLFPLSLASEGSCTIGGNLSTNAGGTAVLAFGSARDLVLGLEVVLADGRVWNGLGKLRKDNTGYDLKHLFIGAEGTLGIITGAVLKLFPRPRSTIAAFCGVQSPAAAVELLTLVKARAGASLITFEITPRFGVEMAVRHMGCRDPLASAHPWYVLFEVASQDEDDGETVEEIVVEALEGLVVEDAVLAQSPDRRDAFWQIRETMSAAQGFEGGSIKHDVSVPVSVVPELIEKVDAELEAFLPGIRPFPFGHLGDGNIHYNVSQPVGMDRAEYMALWDPVSAIVHKHVLAAGGSISAEHGIGRLKRRLLADTKDPVALDLMRTIKAALDPKGLLNPGKVL